MKRINFFVGPNGCGKTQQLVELSRYAGKSQSVISISNTPFSRFSRSRLNREVFRISPRGIETVVIKNLVQFFDAEGRNTFDISDLLEDIGFHPDIELKVDLKPFWDVNLSAITTSETEQQVLRNLLTEIIPRRGGQFSLSKSSDSLARSLRGQNRILFKYIDKLKSRKIIDRCDLVFSHPERGQQSFSALSSGEQTLIGTFLFIRSHISDVDMILIDEPENSLHPKWQRKYLEFIHMALGYHEASIYLATHSPVLVSGAVASYAQDVDVMAISGDERKVLNVFGDGASESVEEILLAAFDTLTPANSHLSELISELTWSVQEGRATRDEALSQLDELAKKSYSNDQIRFLTTCKKIIASI
jgi:ABC-type cobalamin/Fe3+-siderophores transport system ATPase subunit